MQFSSQTEGHHPILIDKSHVLLSVFQVKELEATLRNIGIHTCLKYKPDVYSYMGIYRNNSCHIPPSLYTSDYNVVTGASQIRKSASWDHEGSSDEEELED